MEIGSKEWITRAAERLGTEAEPVLEKITSAAFDRHGLGQLKLSQTDATRLACFAAEIQSESFRIGLCAAMKLAKEMVEGAVE